MCRRDAGIAERPDQRARRLEPSPMPIGALFRAVRDRASPTVVAPEPLPPIEQATDLKRNGATGPPRRAQTRAFPRA